MTEADSYPELEFVASPSAQVAPLQRAKEVVDFQNEKPIHRQVCYLAAAGYRAAEIAKLTDMARSTVYAILRTPRARELVAELIHTQYDDEINLIIKGGLVDAVMTLRELCIEGVNESTRVSCAKELLAQSKVTPPKKTPSSILAQIEELQDDDANESTNSSHLETGN